MLCVSLTPHDLPFAPARTDPALAVEVRLDHFDQAVDAAGLRAATAGPLLATFRSEHHLGRAAAADRDGSGWEQRLACLKAGFDWIDLELDENDLDDKIAAVHAAGKKVVLSHHSLSVGVDLEPFLERALATRADILKIIGTGGATADFATQRRLYQRAGTRPLVHFFMGADYYASRVLSLRYGAPFTFVAKSEAAAVAPGQVSISRMRDLFGDRGGPFEAFAVLGLPIAHSRSPGYHTPLLRSINQNALFVPLPGETDADLALLLQTFPELRGAAVTKPLKEAAARRADRFVHPEAADLGAVNTLLRDGSTWSAANTDYLAMETLLEDVVPAGRTVRVLGYGGLGKAVVAACLKLGLPVEVTNRSAEKCRDLPAQARFLAWETRHEAGAYALVQATSVGMAPHDAMSPLERVPEGVAVVMETIYNPAVTQLMKQAEAAGARVLDGMLLFEKQAEIQNRLFRETLTADIGN
ncbi:type I 3-dehydroquinate dehydratase [Acanthopleuribacter pedis]|uniref:Type I 3-dehydroquinate dehydratase n=1 Tax=Acanthopleuribacter pedis TaxID=442870 RepID=A0A8J7QDD6_9BACT|nr:type I 3-dehydroquinate dehydratase [Acanthopleuribacter pedis]MBO1322074.1 type I 3-dehydroquinate dehydratase [Acanthopleuribacter pedis]